MKTSISTLDVMILWLVTVPRVLEKCLSGTMWLRV